MDYKYWEMYLFSRSIFQKQKQKTFFVPFASRFVISLPAFDHESRSPIGYSKIVENNRPFPSSLVPLFQNESKCETLKMSSACSLLFMQIKVVFIRTDGLAVRLAVKQRHKGTRKWPIQYYF